MTPETVWTIARRRIVEVLDQPVAPTVYFVDDDDVSYDSVGVVRVRRSALFDLDTDRWAALLAPTPVWIHLNLLRVDDKISVVTVRRSGGSIASDEPHGSAVNVSAGRVAVTIDES